MTLLRVQEADNSDSSHKSFEENAPIISTPSSPALSSVQHKDSWSSDNNDRFQDDVLPQRQSILHAWIKLGEWELLLCTCTCNNAWLISYCPSDAHIGPSLQTVDSGQYEGQREKMKVTLYYSI